MSTDHPSGETKAKRKNVILPSKLPTTTALFHYCDFAKLVAMLQSQTLWLARLTEFQDKQEGRFFNREPWKNIVDIGVADAMRPDDTFVLNEQEILDIRTRVIDKIASKYRTASASCWTIDESTSDLMWLAYAPILGMAIETTIGDLHDSVPSVDDDHVLICGEVEYNSNSILGLLQKRPRFKNEREYRVLHWDFEKEGHVGHALAVNLKKLIKKLWISPHNTPSWLIEVVKREMAQYGLEGVPVEQDVIG